MATVQVGGHITLLFSIHDDALLPRNQGSRGAGLSLAKGVALSIEETGRSEVIEEGQEMAGWNQTFPPSDQRELQKSTFIPLIQMNP